VSGETYSTATCANTSSRAGSTPVVLGQRVGKLNRGIYVIEGTLKVGTANARGVLYFTGCGQLDQEDGSQSTTSSAATSTRRVHRSTPRGPERVRACGRLQVRHRRRPLVRPVGSGRLRAGADLSVLVNTVSEQGSPLGEHDSGSAVVQRLRHPMSGCHLSRATLSCGQRGVLSTDPLSRTGGPKPRTVSIGGRTRSLRQPFTQR